MPPYETESICCERRLDQTPIGRPPQDAVFWHSVPPLARSQCFVRSRIDPDRLALFIFGSEMGMRFASHSRADIYRPGHCLCLRGKT